MAELTQAEREELAQRQLAQLRREQAHDDFNKAIRAAGKVLLAHRDTLVERPGKELDERRIARAYRQDVADAPRPPCDHRRDDLTLRHRPGSMASVACRLGTSVPSLWRARKRLGSAWPPSGDDPPLL